MVDSACGCDSVRVEKHMKEFSDANMLPGKGGGRGGGRGDTGSRKKNPTFDLCAVACGSSERAWTER